MSQMIITFPGPQRIELVQGAELSLSFPAPQGITLQLEGIQGPPGEGVPVGGATGEVLTKSSATNFDTIWTPVASLPEVAANTAKPTVGLAIALRFGAFIN